MKVKNLLIAVSLAVSTLSCQKEKAPETSSPATVQDNPVATDPAALINDFTPEGDAILVPDFSVKLELDNEVFKLLKDSGESVIASYYFYGNVANEKSLPADIQKNMDLYGLTLLSGQLEENNIEEPEINFNFKGLKIPKKLYDVLSDKDVHINIIFFSGRKSFENNILDVDAFDSSFSDVLKKDKQLTYKVKLLK